MEVEEFPNCCGFRIITHLNGTLVQLDRFLTNNETIIGPKEVLGTNGYDEPYYDEDTGRAAILIALNNVQQNTYSELLLANGYSCLLKGNNRPHGTQCFLWAKVDKDGTIAKSIAR